MSGHFLKRVDLRDDREELCGKFKSAAVIKVFGVVQDVIDNVREGLKQTFRLFGQRCVFVGKSVEMICTFSNQIVHCLPVRLPVFVVTAIWRIVHDRVHEPQNSFLIAG